MYNVIMYTVLYTVRYSAMYTASILGQDEGYTFKYSLSPEGVPEAEARGNS